MKNIIVVMLSSIVFILTAHAKPEHKNLHQDIKTKIEQKNDREKKSQKRKLDITVKKHRKSNDKSTNWTGKKKVRDFEKDKNNVSKGAKKKHEKANKDFHKWSNKTQDSIESRIKRKDPKYRPADPFYNERHGQPGAF